jgi:L-ribulokinase
MTACALGIDFGTQSARALLVEVATGRELGHAEMAYPHGVMDRRLPGGALLPADWALQHPQDYLDCVGTIVPEALRRSGVRAQDVIGVGIDCTACTMLPVDARGVPLCFYDEYKNEPNAYVKLWKHHAAQEEANRLTALAAERGEAFLSRYGGKVSSEWMFPKLWQTLSEAPQLYAKTARFMEVADWIILKMTGVEACSACMAGYKALWNKQTGYPSKAFFAAADARLANVVEEKLPNALFPAGHRAGVVTKEAALWTGLCPGTAVAVANVDAHVSLPAVGIAEPGKMLLIMGTSICHMLLGDEERPVPGICGVVEDGILPGFVGYEAGQCCVGDLFDWFVRTCVPESYALEAHARGIGLHELLTEKAARLKAGESGLLALDWWNGNRSILVDAELSGVMFGMTLQTLPEEMYLALIESTAFGTRMIIEAFTRSGVPVDELYACGGIAEKNARLMQIYADVTGRKISIGRSSQSPALGSAMFGAVAAGKTRGGYDTIEDAARVIGGVKDVSYVPDARNHAIYDRLYAEYARLHDLFGRGGDLAVKNLRAIRLVASSPRTSAHDGAR